MKWLPNSSPPAPLIRLPAGAQAQLVCAPLAGEPAPSATELLHVLQIELEMQNEALRQAQIASEQSRDRYVRLYEFASVGYLTVSDACQITEINLTGAAMFGVERKKLLDHRPDAFVVATDRERWNREFISVMAQDGTGSFDLTLRHPDGALSDVHLDCLRMDNGDARPTLDVTLTNITERKRAERNAERERIRLQTILSMASDGIHIVDSDGVLVEANEAFLNMLGYDNSAIGKLRIPDWDAQDPWETIKVRDDELLRRRGPLVFETRHRRRDGLVLDVEISATGIEIEGNSYIYAASRDITKRKQMELQLRIAAISFESQEGMFITDAARRILRVNQSFSNITGFTAEEAVGQTPTLLYSGQHDVAFYTEMNESLEHSGTWKGEIWNRRKNGEIYPEWLSITAVRNDLEEITNYVATLSDITLRKATENEIKHLAYYDPLTSLPNRRLLLDRLERTLAANSRRQREGALLFIDLDNFKSLNDTLGHNKGDQLLQQVAQRLRDCVRESDTVSRLGGDEFVVMLEDLSGNSEEAASQAEAVATKILAELTLPYKLAEYEHHCTASLGISLFADHCDTAEELLKRADLAMYEAKAAGRNTMRFFNPKMQAVITVRAAMEAEMHEALLKKQFVLHYQAQVTSENELIGAEALICWNHPQRGIVPPIEFIPLAEETGLILPLGQWALEAACAQLAAWAARAEMANFTVAVKVSARQFHQPDFVNQVQAALDGSGANPKRLKLELTETLLVSDIEDVIAKMLALKARGVSLSLDDFGIGYSSLSYLKRLPLDQLKIDQRFVRHVLTDSDAAVIAKMVNALGDSLGLTVIADGVEIEAQKDFLASFGCHCYQGYLFSGPLPLREFEEFVNRV